MSVELCFCLEEDCPRQHSYAPSNTALDLLDAECKVCAPFGCDNPDVHLGVDPKYTPLANLGCRCGADIDGRDCMCFEGIE